MIQKINIWIEKDSGFIVKVEDSIDDSAEDKSLHQIQLFACHNEEIVITPPAFQLVLPEGTLYSMDAGS